jgi:hypothetical protein
MIALNFDDLETAFVFRSRPKSIPGDLRPLWRIGIILLILRLASWGKKSSLGRLHVLNWAIRTEENREELEEVIAGNISPDTVIVRIEPSLNRAIDFAHGEGLLEFVSGDRVQLTPIGKSATNKLLNQDNLFREEKLFLRRIGKTGLTEKIVKELFGEGYI